MKFSTEAENVITKRNGESLLSEQQPWVVRYRSKSENDKFYEAAAEVLEAYQGDINGRQAEFQRDLMVAAGRKGLSVYGKSRKRKRW